MGQYRRLLRNRNFALLWSGQTASVFGDGLTFVSLVWLAYELGGSPVDVAILAACYTAPVIVGGLVAGLLLDRFDRRLLLMADNAVRGLAMLSIPITAWLGVLALPQLFGVAIVYGLLYMVSLAGFPSILPDLVADDELSTANAMESLSFGIGGVAGPAVAGVLIGVIGGPNVLLLDALTYLAFVVCLALAKLPPRRETDEPVDETSAAGGLVPAVRFVLRTPAILAITLMFMAFNVGEGVLIVLLPVYAREVLEVGASGYGLLVSAFTGGVLLGSLAIGAMQWPWPLGRSLGVAQASAGVAAIGLAVLPPLAGAIGVLFLVGLLASPLTIWAQTIRMRLIPDALRGRVFALLRTMMQGATPLGGLTAGLVLTGYGLLPAILLAGGVMGVPGVIGAVHGALSERSTSGARADAAL